MKPPTPLVPRELPLSIAGALALAMLQWWPAFRRPDATGFGDWQMVHHNWEAAHVSLTRFFEWPLWDPFHCGGIPILGNPESQLYSPLFLLSLPLGTVLAAKWFLVLHVAAGLCGMYWLARAVYGLQPLACVLAAVAWAGSGVVAWDGAGGHVTFLPFLFAPWLVLGFRRALEKPRAFVWLVGLLTLTLYEGGTYPFPYLLLLLGFEAAVALASGHAPARVGKLLVLVGVGIGLCGAIRLLPIALALADTPRLLESPDALSLAQVWTMLTARAHPWSSPDHLHVWAEYGSYVGFAAPLLALAGLFAALSPGRRHLVAGLLLFGALMLGSRAPYYPWPLLHQLPVFDSLRVPSRFSILFTFYLALLAGLALSWLLQRLPPSRTVVASAVLLLGLYVADLAAVNHPVIDRFDRPALEPARPARAFQLVRGSYGRRYASYPRLHLGTADCYQSGMEWRVADGLWAGPRPQVRIPDGLGELSWFRRTASGFELELTLHASGRVLVDQNHAPGWRSDVGEVADEGGLLALDLPAGRSRVKAWYRPGHFPPALGLSLLGWLLLALAARPRVARRLSL